ncbi:hypothetical protein L1W90_11365, partial [Acinetobacter baumannii]|nr:hypothetical protein [Acinetobacter baumannii]MCF4327455.1 hypothetical protein [Acinetobacter baumannii]
ISLPFFVFFRFGGMPRAKGLFRAKVSISQIINENHYQIKWSYTKVRAGLMKKAHTPILPNKSKPTIVILSFKR